LNIVKQKGGRLQTELSAIKKWLKKDGNTEAKLAYALGYQSSVAIKMWFKRKNVPVYMRQRTMEVIAK